MPACFSTSDAACRVDVRLLALAIPPMGLAPDAVARADWRSAEARNDAPIRAWVWQHGAYLIVLDHQANGAWHLAELGFHHAFGYYMEQRRALYGSAREAIGAALSRILKLGHDLALAAASTLDAWCSVAFEYTAESGR